MAERPEKEITRRRFHDQIRARTGCGECCRYAAEVALAQQPLAVPDPPGKKLGWAVVGLGNLI